MAGDTHDDRRTLSSQRQWSSTRSRKFLASIAIPEIQTIASLTERQRSLLATKI
jgi:hypothetical protein